MLLCLIGLVLLTLSACRSETVLPTRTPAPTQTLIAAAPTHTATPTLIPTATRTALPAAADVALTLTAQVTPDPTAEFLREVESYLEIAEADLEQRLESASTPYYLARAERVTWGDSDLECTRITERNPQRVDGYRIMWVAGETVYSYHTDQNNTVRLCREESLYETHPDLFLERDPIAQELVALAQERLGRKLDLSVRRITLKSITPATWEDSSLGCPLEGQTYAPLNVVGYRIFFTVNDSEYIYHTDFERVLECE